MTLLVDDVGLGKTISAGLVASELIAWSRASKFDRRAEPLGLEAGRTPDEVHIPADFVTGSKLIAANCKIWPW